MSLAVGKNIRGLVGASGAGGCMIGTTNDWSLVIHLVAYRAEGVLTQTTLRCEMPMSRELMQQWMSRVKPYVMLDAMVVGLTERGDALISELEILEVEDPNLAAIREELLVPVIVQSPTFGALVLNRRGGQYEGNAQWCGVDVRLSLSCADLTNPSTAIAIAESVFGAQEEWDKRVKEFAAERLLELKNDSWLEDEQEELSREDFMSHMKLQEISVEESGDFGLWHDDGDLFFGHTILVSGNLERGLTDAGIHG